MKSFSFIIVMYYIYLYFFLYATRNMNDITSANTSAAVTDHHIPSSPWKIGIMITAAILKIKVLRKDIAADIPPLLSAVKNDEANIVKPLNMNASENILNACFVIAKSSASYPTNTFASVPASVNARTVIMLQAIPMMMLLFLNMFLSSSVLPAP